MTLNPHYVSRILKSAFLSSFSSKLQEYRLFLPVWQVGLVKTRQYSADTGKMLALARGSWKQGAQTLNLRMFQPPSLGRASRGQT